MENLILLLPLASAICLFVALIQAWLMTLERYFRVAFVRRIFPNYRDLVRSHVDYLMMSSLIFAVYLVTVHLSITLPEFIIWAIFIGALYNPFGFILQAIKPDIAESGGVVTKAGVVVGFLPLSIGLIWSSITLISTILERI